MMYPLVPQAEAWHYRPMTKMKLQCTYICLWKQKLIPVDVLRVRNAKAGELSSIMCIKILAAEKRVLKEDIFGSLRPKSLLDMLKT